MSNRGRGYGRALLQIHAHNENILAQEAIEEATKAREDEKWHKDLWSIAGKVVGSYFGPIGSFALGEALPEIYDYIYDEGELIPDFDPKFNKYEYGKQMEALRDYDKSTSFGGDEWIADFGKDLFTTYLLAGGYSEGVVNPDTGLLEGSGFNNPFNFEEMDWLGRKEGKGKFSLSTLQQYLGVI